MTEHYSQVSAQEKLAAQHLAFGDVLASARKKTIIPPVRQAGCVDYDQARYRDQGKHGPIGGFHWSNRDLSCMYRLPGRTICFDTFTG